MSEQTSGDASKSFFPLCALSNSWVLIWIKLATIYNSYLSKEYNFVCMVIANVLIWLIVRCWIYFHYWLKKYYSITDVKTSFFSYSAPQNT